MLHPVAFGMPGGVEWIWIAAIALLLFGKRLPEVGKSLGKGIVEFKKGLKGIEDEVEDASSQTPAVRPAITSNTGHKFDPYTGQPIQEPKFDPYTGKPIDQETTAPPTEGNA